MAAQAGQSSGANRSSFSAKTPARQRNMPEFQAWSPEATYSSAWAREGFSLNSWTG